MIGASANDRRRRSRIVKISSPTALGGFRGKGGGRRASARVYARSGGSAALAARRDATCVPGTRSAPPRSGKKTPPRRRSSPRSAALGFSIHPDRTHRRTLGSRFATSAVPCAGDRAESAVRAMTYLSSGARDRANGLSVGARERGAPGHLDAAAEEAGGATGGRASRLARDGRGGDGGDNRLARHRAGSRNGARCSGRNVRLPFGRDEVKRSTRRANRQCERRCGRAAPVAGAWWRKIREIRRCAFAFGQGRLSNPKMREKCRGLRFATRFRGGR